MKNFDDVKIYKDSPGIKAVYIFQTLIDDGKIMPFPHSFFEWREIEDEELSEWTSGWLYLKDISDQIEKKMKILPVIYVWIEAPLNGTIYQIGNYPGYKHWIKNGSTRGYA